MFLISPAGIDHKMDESFHSIARLSNCCHWISECVGIYHSAVDVAMGHVEDEAEEDDDKEGENLRLNTHLIRKKCGHW